MGLAGQHHIAALCADSLANPPEIFLHCLRPVSTVKTQVHGRIAPFAHAAKPGRKSVVYDSRAPEERELQIWRIVPLLIKYMLTVLICESQFHSDTSLSYPVNAFFTWVTAVPSMPITSKRQSASVFPRSVR